jgi:GDP-L-fucose synthase
MIKKILILGSSGFVGSNFLNDPRVDNYMILCPKRKELDLTKQRDLYDYLNYTKPDLIINAAGKVGGILINSKNNFDFLNQNLIINYNIINASKESNVNNLINLSSSCIYPINFNKPLSENDLMSGKLEPTNEGYALSKIYALKSCQYLSKQFKYKTIIPCNLYGPYDDFDEKTSHMIPGLISRTHQAINNNKKKIKIWGNGKVRREFMFITDFIDFLFFSIENFNSLPDVINVGLGYDLSIKDYYEEIFSVLNYKGELIYDNTKPSGIKRKLMDISRLKKIGWKPKTSLSKGIELTYKYYKSKYE